MHDHEVALFDVRRQRHFARQTVHRVAGGAEDDARLDVAGALVAIHVHHLDPVDHADHRQFHHGPVNTVVQEHMRVVADRFDTRCQREGIATERAARFADQQRAVVAKRLKPVAVEAIVRGYIVGSGWKEYQKSGTVCGIALPAGLKEASKLAQPIFTPSTKAAVGDHDENISFAQCEAIIGAELAAKVRDTAIALYSAAVEYAATRGIIIADTKFEFGLDEDGTLTLMDEVLTPDSSRFWPADSYAEGSNPPSFDKQFVRDWLESTGWNKEPPAPAVPADVAQKTADKYREALTRLTV